jgi:RNA polymerase sigma-70 factor (sigma-E family)
MERVAGEDTVQVVPGRVVPDPIPSSDFVSLYRRQRTAMIRLARLLTRSEVIAEEVVQEAFLHMHQRREPPENPEGFLRTTVTNLSRNYTRRLRVERRHSSEARATFNDPEIDETWAILCRLPFRQRAVIALRFYEDLSEAEIARILDCRPGTVKSSLHRGLARLREEMS